MKAILLRIKPKRLPTNDYPLHPILMFFTHVGNNSIEYSYHTSVETQFELPPHSIKGNETLQNYVSSLENNIGKVHEINLYDFTFSEMTKGSYQGYKNKSYLNHNQDKVIHDFHIASYKTRNDAMYEEISKIFIMCLQGDIVGVKPNGLEEIIDDPKGLFYDDSDMYIITEAMLSSVSTDYIIYKSNLQTISAGEILVNKKVFSDCRSVDKLTLEIEKYRRKYWEVNRINSSLRKLIFFWEKPEPLPKLDITDKEFVLLKTSYLNQTKFPDKCCDEQIKTYMASTGQTGPFSDETRNLREFIKKDSKERAQKYKGKNMGKIKVIDM